MPVEIIRGMPEPVRVLYAEDEPMLQQTLADFFGAKQYEIVVHTVDHGREGLHLHRQKSIDYIVSDYQMPEMDGVELFNRLQERGVTIPFIFYTSSPAPDERIREKCSQPPEKILRKGADGVNDVVEAVIAGLELSTEHTKCSPNQ